MDATSGEVKKIKGGRPKLDYNDLATRITTTNAGEDYQDVCINNVFERIKFEGILDGKNIQRPAIPDADISVSVPSQIAANLTKMGITQLLPTQRYTLPLLTDRDTDLFVGAATGHGKTLAFLIPIAVSLMRSPRKDSSSRRPLALVIANTQVLQVQTYKVALSLLAETGLRAVLVCGQTKEDTAILAIEKGVDIIIATTGRLMEFLKRKVVVLDALRYFIYDEADKMTEMGTFRADVMTINEYIPAEIKPQLRSCFFTATIDAINTFDKMYRTDRFCTVLVPGNPLITHRILPLGVNEETDHAKSLILMRLLLKDVQSQGRMLFDKAKQPYLQKTIVFVAEKKNCNFLQAYLRLYGYSVGLANSDLSLLKRNDIIDRFSKGEIQALIATDSMARGHDIPNVTHVINYDMGENTLDNFKHRAGRTARIGHKGTCTTLLSRRQFELYDNPNISESSRARQRAAELAKYLLIECGQRIPACLVQSAYTAIRKELAEWGLDLTPEQALSMLGYETDESNAESSSLQVTPTRAQAAKVATKLDEDGFPIFDAPTYNDDKEEHATGIIEDEFDDDSYFLADEYPAEVDADSEAERVAALQRDYDRQQGMKN